MHEPQPPVGCDGNRRIEMTALSQVHAGSTGLVSIFSALAVGVALLYFAGFAEASVFHDSAHDTRHTLAFPCH